MLQPPCLRFSMDLTTEKPVDYISFDINLVESAVIYTVTTLMNSFFGPSEALLAFENEYLSAVPGEDGTVTVNHVSDETFGAYRVIFVQNGNRLKYEITQVASAEEE